ncbi:hypothetical protein SALBM311S_05530 [Streptomyces alboniger]
MPSRSNIGARSGLWKRATSTSWLLPWWAATASMSANFVSNEPEVKTAFCSSASAAARYVASARDTLRRAFFPASRGNLRAGALQ